MTTLEIIYSLSEEQAGRIVPVIRAMKADDLAGAKEIAEGLTVEELNLLKAMLEAVSAERKGVTEHG